jgi:hypothetical protein
VGTFLDSANGGTRPFSERFNGTAWKVVPMPPVNSPNRNAFFQFNAITVNSPGDVWAADDSGVADQPSSQETLIERFNGTARSIVLSRRPAQSAFCPVSPPPTPRQRVGRRLRRPCWTPARQTLPLYWNGTCGSRFCRDEAGQDHSASDVSTSRRQRTQPMENGTIRFSAAVLHIGG